MKLDQLHRLSELKYQQSQHLLSAILERETKLRNELIKLRGFVKETRALPKEQAQMRAIGADVIWLRWVNKTQASLNIELAQVLAQKEGHMARHKLAFGKEQVSDTLVKNEREARRQAQREKALEKIIQQTIY